MGNTDNDTLEINFLSALADLLMYAGRDRAADAIYAAIEIEASPAPRPALRVVHSAEPDLAKINGDASNWRGPQEA